MPKHFVPTSFEVQRDNKTGESVQISFFNDADEPRSVVMARDQIALFVSHLLAEAKVSPNAPIDPAQMSGVVEPLGRELRFQADGSVVMTFHLRTDDGGRSLPIHLSLEEREQFARDLLPKPQPD